MRVVICPDSFKGCLSAPEVASALAQGVTSVVPDASTVLCPLSDGGEGMLDTLKFYVQGESKIVEVRGPYGESVQAEFLLAADGTAYIEMARASGLSLTSQRDPLQASSYGTGQLLKAAIEAGAQRVVMGLGGSATVDGGMGALQALGVRFYDADDELLKPVTCELLRLDHIELPENLLEGVKLTVLCDVLNPLLGTSGAVRCFGPQKGANASDMAMLEEGLRLFAKAIERETGIDPSNFDSGGSAGGLAAGFATVLGATLDSGALFFVELAQLRESIDSSDFVMCGEGRIDYQSLFGKTVSAVIPAASGKPIFLFAGDLTAKAELWYLKNFPNLVLFSIQDAPRSLESAMDEAPQLLSRAAARAARIWSLR